LAAMHRIRISVIDTCGDEKVCGWTTYCRGGRGWEMDGWMLEATDGQVV
jgi:hypothetical protein